MEEDYFGTEISVDDYDQDDAALSVVAGSVANQHSGGASAGLLQPDDDFALDQSAPAPARCKLSRRLQPVPKSVQCKFNCGVRLDLLHIKCKLRRGLADYTPSTYGHLRVWLPRPKVLVSLYSDGGVVVNGTDEDTNLYACRKLVALLRKMGVGAELKGFRFTNITSCMDLQVPVDLGALHKAYPRHCTYEPERFPSASFRLKPPFPSCCAHIFANGKLVMVGAASSASAAVAAEWLVGMLRPFAADRSGFLQRNIIATEHPQDAEAAADGAEAAAADGAEAAAADGAEAAAADGAEAAAATAAESGATADS
eukprot:TRINITY_DN5544_c0_g1_i1.p1 TRINITY_DN5544_c0_g1~~TRINITY_DN5544_c0_g1_i1.p1  ORF type:complete len:328 (+),score=103.27 TRINITY_DN5544_c0_g1_i1:51-986(+)